MVQGTAARNPEITVKEEVGLIGGTYATLLGGLITAAGVERLGGLLRTGGEKIKVVSPTTGALLELAGGAVVVGVGLKVFIGSALRGLESSRPNTRPIATSK